VHFRVCRSCAQSLVVFGEVESGPVTAWSSTARLALSSLHLLLNLHNVQLYLVACLLQLLDPAFGPRDFFTDVVETPGHSAHGFGTLLLQKDGSYELVDSSVVGESIEFFLYSFVLLLLRFESLASINCALKI
jgi:hypothetical protein